VTLDGDLIHMLPYVIMKRIAANQAKLDRSTVREILKARFIAGSVCVSLPRSLRDPIGVESGDHVMITLDKRRRRLIVTKE